MDRLVEIARFAYLAEAEMLVSLLKSEGIDATIRNEHMSRVYPGMVPFDPRVDILEKDVERAMEVMLEAGYELPDEDENPEGVKSVLGFTRQIPYLRKLPVEKQIWWFFLIIAVLIVLLVFLSTHLAE